MNRSHIRSWQLLTTLFKVPKTLGEKIYPTDLSWNYQSNQLNATIFENERFARSDNFFSAT